MPKSTEKAKSLQQAEEFVAALSPQAQAALQQQQKLAHAVSDEQLGFQVFQSSLSEAAKKQLKTTRPSNEPEFTQDIRPGYWLIEQEEGENPTLLSFQDNAEELAQHLHKQLGKDVFVYPFYGVPMQFTEGPRRLLLMPNGQAIEFCPDIRMLRELDSEVRLQSNNFLGPPELQIVVGPDDKPDKTEDADEDDDPEALNEGFGED